MRVIAGVVALIVLTGPAFADEKVTAGTFDADWDSSWWTDGGITAKVIDGTMCASVPGGTANVWDLGIGQDGISLIAGANYTFSFISGGDPWATLRAVIQLPREPWTEFVELPVRATEEPTPHSVTFTAPETVEAQLSFQVGGNAGPWTFCVDDVSVTDAP